MLDPTAYLLFLAACAAIILAPGPAQALVVARTLEGGPRAGALTALGLNAGTLFHSAAAAAGISAILATSALAFSAVKLAGAAYLLYLGVLALRATGRDAARPGPRVTSTGTSFGRAVLTGALNPKVALFFLALLPQFVDPSRSQVVAQFLLLGATLAALDTVYELALVALVHRLRERFLSSQRLRARQSRLTGAVLIGLGLRLAFQKR